MTSRQHLSRFTLVSGVLVVAGLLVAACDSGTGAQDRDAGDQPPPNCTQPGLFLVSPQSVALSGGASTDLQVRYACDSQPYAGALVSFAIDGDGKGSSLSAASSQTGDDGVASVTLTAGSQSASFTVTASAAATSPLTFNITVNTDNVGTIVVTMTYAGSVAFTEYKAYLFQGQACAAIDPFSISGALQEAAAVTVISAKPQFTMVPTGTNYTAAVVAKKGTDVLGFGCTPSINVTSGQKTDTTVAIQDVPITYNGIYNLDNHFDLSGLLPPSVDNIISIFDEMTDDHDVNGNATTDQWGLDPAAFLLDFVYRQFCHWECLGGETYSTCSQANHGWGDLKLIYTQDFKTWSGNIPLFYGACGILDESWGANQYIQNQVQGLITTYVPDVITNLLQMLGDLARAIDKAHITSRLTLTDVRPGRQGNFSHDLLTMIVLLHDWTGAEHTYTADLVAAGVGLETISGNCTVENDKLQIPEHTFQIQFGKVVQYIYLHGLLPLLGYNSTGEMFQDWIDCTSVGTWLYNELMSAFGASPSASTLAGYCNTGLQAAGNYIDTKMDDWITGTTDFTLQGVAAAAALDSHRVATQLDGTPPTSEEGWAGHWVEGATQATFSGTFTGVRQ